ncbi:MAG: Fe-S cluster assembly protein SufD, partial [Actinobacteria bacterium]|nr:Fe-S cluster assembly protein SufD [Actinomycetota bacterium]
MTAVTEHEISLVPATDHSPSVVSLDVNDFAVPTGREEQWRFTPMKRLAGLHEAQTPAGNPISVVTELAEGTSFETDIAKSDDRDGFTDRVSAVAWNHVESVARLTVPKNLVTQTPSVVTFTGK